VQHMSMSCCVLPAHQQVQLCHDSFFVSLFFVCPWKK
jgi:hypothetical protein